MVFASWVRIRGGVRWAEKAKTTFVTALQLGGSVREEPQRAQLLLWKLPEEFLFYAAGLQHSPILVPQHPINALRAGTSPFIPVIPVPAQGLPPKRHI